jgi:hypothetical protein
VLEDAKAQRFSLKFQKDALVKEGRRQICDRFRIFFLVWTKTHVVHFLESPTNVHKPEGGFSMKQDNSFDHTRFQTEHMSRAHAFVEVATSKWENEEQQFLLSCPTQKGESQFEVTCSLKLMRDERFELKCAKLMMNKRHQDEVMLRVLREFDQSE